MGVALGAVRQAFLRRLGLGRRQGQGHDGDDAGDDAGDFNGVIVSHFRQLMPPQIAHIHWGSEVVVEGAAVIRVVGLVGGSVIRVLGLVGAAVIRVVGLVGGTVT